MHSKRAREAQLRGPDSTSLLCICCKRTGRADTACFEEEHGRGLLVARSPHRRAAVIYTSRPLRMGDAILGLEAGQRENSCQSVNTAYGIHRPEKEVRALLHTSCRH